MKRIFKTTILAVFVTFSLSSCRDAIDIVQDGEIDGNVPFTTVSQVEMFLTGSVYGSLDITSQMFFSAQLTDELGMGPQNSELALSAHQYYVDVTNAQVSGIWLGNYTTINRVNRLLKSSSEVVPGSDAEKVRLNHALAQGRLIRAFSYFTLDSYFSTDMKDPNALGVVVFDNVPELDEKHQRVSNAEVFAAIDADIKFADANLSAGNDQYRISRNFLNSFKARYYLYRGMYAEAKIAAQAVINSSGLTLTPATPVPVTTPVTVLDYKNASHVALNASLSTNPYVRMWNDQDRGEKIFSISRPYYGAWANIASLFFANQTTAGGSVLYDMGRNTFNLFGSVAGDIRKFAYIDPTVVIDPNYATVNTYRSTDVLVIDKYPGKSQIVNGVVRGTQPLRNDLKVFRLSEMYFILAEVAVEEGDFARAATLIKNVRDARNYTGPVAVASYGSKADAYKDILLERRKELFLEGHRYQDLKRLGAIAGVAIDRNATDDVKTVPVTIPINDYRMRSLPIPQAESQGNPTIQQNPGYN